LEFKQGGEPKPWDSKSVKRRGLEDGSEIWGVSGVCAKEQRKLWVGKNKGGGGEKHKLWSKLKGRGKVYSRRMHKRKRNGTASFLGIARKQVLPPNW